MKRNMYFFTSIWLSAGFLILLITACAALSSVPVQTSVAQNTTLPTAPIQFTLVPTFTAEVQATLQSTIQPTVDFPTFTPPTMLPGEPNTIRFAANGTYTDISDTIATGTSKTYSINAMKGQIMSISTFPQVPDGDWGYISIQIKGADGSILCPQAPDTECMFWRGALPLSQDYFVTLIPDGNASKFVMRVAINPPGKDVQYFQYKNPATGVSLTYPDIFAPAISVYGSYKTKPELSLHLIDSKTYEKSNLGEVYLFVSSTSDAQVVATCTEPNPNGGGSEQVIGNKVVNGLIFVHSSSEGAGAGNYYEEDIYRTVHKNMCYEVIYFIHSTNAGNYTPGTVTEFDRNALTQKFFDIFSTLTIE